MPLHRGESHGTTVWYVLTETSAADLRFGEATVHFRAIPDFSPTRVLVPGPTTLPAARVQPGAVGNPGYSPFIRIKGSPVVYNAPVVATGNGPFDVVHHTNTADRVLAIHPAAPAGPGQFTQATVDLLVVRGFDAGQPILYISTEASDPLAAVLERATYVPLLNKASFLGGDDALGSGRERIFPFLNGQSGAHNPNAQGLVHLVKDGHATQDADLLTGPGGAPYGSVGFVINCPVVGYTHHEPTRDLVDLLPNAQG